MGLRAVKRWCLNELREKWVIGLQGDSEEARGAGLRTILKEAVTGLWSLVSRSTPSHQVVVLVFDYNVTRD